MWGQVFYHIKNRLSRGIIPMRVGTRQIEKIFPRSPKDHPHACGDKAVMSFTLAMSEGSSPCVWGQDHPFYSVEHSFRIIPMRVGTSCHARRKHYQEQDHPHACGDKTAVLFTLLYLSGSSPCVWGQGKIAQSASTGTRIIPMRVGTRH